MKKQKHRIIFIVFFIFVILFPSNFIFKKESKAYDEGLGPSLEQTQLNGSSWYLSYYGGDRLGAVNPATNERFVNSDFTKKNEKYGWYEYNLNGEDYVVLAGATRELLSDWGGQLDYIHYFKYGNSSNNWKFDLIYFKFDSMPDDDTVYKGIILDSCGVSMNPSKWGKPSKSQWLDVYTCLDENNNPDKKKNEKFNQKKVYVSDNGVFSQGTQNKSLGTFILNYIADGLAHLADGIQMLLTQAATDSKEEDIGELVYSRKEIEADPKLQEQIQVSDPIYEEEEENEATEGSEEESEDDSTKKVFIRLPNYILNQAGFEEMMFETDMQIPVIPIDIYTCTRLKINMLEIDFFSGKANTNKFFNLVRNITIVASKSVLYISAALILTTLIWRSLLLVMASFSQNPERASRAKRKIDSVFKSVIIIAIIYLLMALIMYFYKYIIEFIAVNDTSYYVYKVTIPGNFTFNTNAIGYVKLLTLSTNGFFRLVNVLIYIVAALLNLFIYLLMTARVVLIALCIILAPLTSIATVSTEASGQEIEVKSILNLKNWIKIYTILVFAPIIIILIERIALSIFG